MATTATQIEQLLQSFTPSFVALENESHQHGGYVEGKESHFKLTIVADIFVGKRAVQRHQLIYQKLAGVLTRGGGSVHALAIHAYTPMEWQQVVVSPDSPMCQHAPKH